MLDQQRYGRFKDAPWFPKEETEIIVGGAGGIGSWLVLLLARAGFSPVVYDYDTLEPHNVGGQLYPDSMIGRTKVNALAEVVANFSGINIECLNEKYSKDSIADIFMFSAFDNMKARKDMFLNWLELTKHAEESHAVFIDGRLTMEQLTIFCVRGNDEKAIKEYREKHLFDDSVVADAPCTMKQTSHSAAMIASHMVGFFTNHMTNLAEGMEVREVPFFFEYFIPLNLTRETAD